MRKYTANEISTFLPAANADLGSNKYTGDQMIPDYCKAVIIGQQLQDELDKALKALRNLHDVQNGPPLLRHEKTWQAAYDEAGYVLEEMEQ